MGLSEKLILLTRLLSRVELPSNMYVMWCVKLLITNIVLNICIINFLGYKVSKELEFVRAQAIAERR